MKLFTFLAALLPLSLMAQIGTGPSVRMTNSSATTLTAFSPTNSGTTTFKSPIVDSTTAPITIGPYNTGLPGLDADFGQLAVRGSTNGVVIQDRLRVPYATYGNNNTFGLGGIAFETIGRMYNRSTAVVRNDGDRLRGAAANQYMPYTAGSAASMSDLPAQGNETWANQRLPSVYIISRGNVGINNQDNCTEAYAKESIISFRTNGLLQFTTNLGIHVIYEMCDGWLTNHRSASGYLQWDTNRWPSATVNPSNVANIFLTNGIKAGVMMYMVTHAPTNGNTEVDIDPVVGTYNLWHYPNGVNNLGAVEIQPCIDPNTVHRDISQFYAWNIWSLSIQDPDTAEYGYQQGARHSMSYAIQYPYSIVPLIQEDRPYKSWYNNAPHGIIYNQMLATPVTRDIWPISMEYDANGVCFGTGADSTEPAGSGVLGYTIGAIRPELHFWTNVMPGTIKLIMQTDPLAFMDIWSYTDWKNHMSLVGMFNANLWLTAPHARYWTNSAFGINYTNLCTNGIWRDPKQGRVVAVRFGTTNIVIAKPLERASKWAVWLGNMSPTATTNLTIPFSALGYTNGPSTAMVRDVWTNSFLGISNNFVTLSVPPTNHRWITLEFTSGAQLVDSLSVSNLGVALSQSGQTLQVGGGLIVIDTSRTNVGINGGGLPSHAFTIYPISNGEGLLTLSFSTFYDMGRNNSDGMLTIAGSQAGANGLRLTGVDGEFALFRPTFATLPKPTAMATNTANGNTLTNDIVVGAKTTARNQRFSIAVSAFGTANLTTGVDASLVVSNASDGKILTQKFSLPSGVLAVYTVTNELCIPDADPLSIYWLTNCSVVPGTTIITYK